MVAIESFDVAVVGGGAAGCVVASRLAAAGDRSVVLVEAGPDLRGAMTDAQRDGWHLPTVPDWGFESDPDPERGVAPKTLRRGRLLGGTSWLARFAVRGAAADFETWAERGNAGWAFADVLPVFRRLETDVEFGDAPWHGTTGPIPISRYVDARRSEVHLAALDALSAMGVPAVTDHNAPGALGVGPMPMSTRTGQRVTSLDAYLPATGGLPGLTIRADAPVAHVTLDGDRASGVRLVDGTDIRAALTVLCAGTYASPPILMRSGIGPAAHLRELGIDVNVDLAGVGENLADHPGVDLDTGYRGAGSDAPILHSIATLRSRLAPSGGAPDLMFWLSDPESEDPGFYADPILLKPSGRGRVRLRSADPTAPPRIALPTSRDDDIERLVEGYRIGLELATRPPVRRLATNDPPATPRTPDEWRRRVAENAYSLPHVVGTCAMGPSPRDGAVVDEFGQVHGVRDLRVVDASIIPDAPSGFPHLITIMLAERLSQQMLGGQ